MSATKNWLVMLGADKIGLYGSEAEALDCARAVLAANTHDPDMIDDLGVGRWPDGPAYSGAALSERLGDAS